LPEEINELCLLVLFLENGNVIDPQYNAVLRATLEECRRNNMPKETIDRSIKRAVRYL
jgi:transcriptional/translational regulatory protein YebC/TACO1